MRKKLEHPPPWAVTSIGSAVHQSTLRSVNDCPESGVEVIKPNDHEIHLTH